MSFSQDVKSELASIDDLSDCCLKAQTYGLLLFGKSFSSTRIGLLTENKVTSEVYVSSCSRFCGVTPKVIKTKANNYSISVTNGEDIKKIIHKFGHTSKNIALRINRSNLEEDCCYGSFLRGVFLSCGTIADPQKNYHLEFVVPYFKLSHDLMSILVDMNLSPKLVERNLAHIIYFKDSESIEDILTLMGATSSTLELMGVKMVKDVRNKINRKINFETANISRTVNAAVAQTEAINKIISIKGIDFLPDSLKIVASARLDNPDMSLDELKDIIDEDISRSGVNHRLNKLIKIANDL